MDHRTRLALEALATADVDFLSRVVPGVLVPTALLQPMHVPRDTTWKWPSLAQAFALCFDGYAWLESNAVDPADLSREMRTQDAFVGWSVDRLRAALFVLQREFHDSWSEPDPAVVVRLLQSLRNALA